MPNHVLTKFNTTWQSISKMLEDIRVLLGLSQEEFTSVLSLLEKVDFGSLDFRRGSTKITFYCSSSVDSTYSGISIEIQVGEGDVKQTVEYDIPMSILQHLTKVTSQVLPKFNANQNLSKTLEGIRLLLGLSQEELILVLALCEKADYVTFSFERGNIKVGFRSNPSLDYSYNDVQVSLVLKEGLFFF